MKKKTTSDADIAYQAGKDEGKRIERERIRRGLRNAGTLWHSVPGVSDGFATYSKRQVDALVEPEA